MVFVAQHWLHQVELNESTLNADRKITITIVH